MATVFSPAISVTPQEFRRGTEVTYLGQVYGTLAALKRMRSRDRGTIVNVGSALSYRAIPLQSVYCGAKYAVRGFTDALRSELIHDRSAIKLVMVHLPAVNTPQFEWALNKTGLRPQPMPPIYQAEVAARAIYFAATRLKHREIWVGQSAIKAIIANKLAPSLLDHYLATSGYTGQLTEEAVSYDAPANLFETVDGDFGAHGRFDRQARNVSLELTLRRHAGVAVAAVLGAVALALVGRYLSRHV